MKLGIPTRGFDTDRECPECGSADHVKRRGEQPTKDGYIGRERYQCDPPDGCGFSWWVEIYDQKIESDHA